MLWAEPVAGTLVGVRSIVTLTLMFTVMLGSACTSERADPVRAEPVPASPLADRADDPREALPMRVLVTGFNDWRDLGEPANVWRCRDNPSCRLLLGAVHDQRPTSFAGPLVARLEARAPSVEWRFATMPVTWGAFEAVPSDVDVIINIGLGVYDRDDALQLEAGAYNLRRGADAAGSEQPGPISVGAAQVLEPPDASPITAQLGKLAGRTLAGYAVLVADAREANSYLCNETHYHALSAVDAVERLRAVYFLHIPHARADDYEALAEGVSGVVLALLDAG